MNRKIQETDALFIVNRYHQNKHAFNAHQEAEKYGVSIVTIYNVLTRAGIQMQRGRKPTQPPQPLISPPPPPFVALDDRTREDIDTAASAPLLNPLNPLNPPSFPGLPPKSPREPRRGPPIIRP